MSHPQSAAEILASPHGPSYRRFLDEKLQRLIQGVFPRCAGNRTINFGGVDVAARYPYTAEECASRGDTLAWRVRVTVEDTGAKKPGTPQWLVFELPRLTEQDTFVLRGVERVPVAQLRLLPGIYFVVSETQEHDRAAQATIWPARGRDITLRLEWGIGGKPAGFEGIGGRGRWPLREFLEKVALRDRAESLLRGRATVSSLLQQRVRATMPEPLAAWIQRALQGNALAVLSPLGRERFTTRLGEYAASRGLCLPTDPGFGAEDLLAAVVYLMDLFGGVASVHEDDPADLRNRRVMLVGDHLEEAVEAGLAGFPKEIDAAIKGGEGLRDALGTSANRVHAALAKWSRSGLCQALDQTNPLSEVSHKRKVTFRGPGGVTSKWGSRKLRGLHPSHYGRLCVLETPESEEIGLNLHLATYAGVTESGEISVPYRGPAGACRLSPSAEDGLVFAAAPTPGMDGTVLARKDGEAVRVSADQVTHTDQFPGQCLGVAAMLVPFIAHDDLNRAMMGAKNLKQALPLCHPELPLVGTGMEEVAGALSGRTLLARGRGEVTHLATRPLQSGAEITELVVRYADGGHLYTLEELDATPSGTYRVQAPRVQSGDAVTEGQVLAEGAGLVSGTLAVGTNLLVAYMPWRGYNFEDGIVLSERCVDEHLLTSRHVERLRFEIRGDEQLVEETLLAEGEPVASGTVLFRKAPADGGAPMKVRAAPGVQGKVLRRRVLPITCGLPRGDDPRTVREIVLIWVMAELPVQVGDKLTGRHGNKGIVARILPSEDMPHLEDGTPVDMIFNPHSVVSRMNLGQLFETHLGWAARVLECAFTAAPFQRIILRACRDSDLRAAVEQILAESRRDEDSIAALLELANRRSRVRLSVGKSIGKAVLRDGREGRPFEAPVTVGMQYILKLNHLAEEKLQGREEGEYAGVSDQPVKGRRLGGGQRVGEMEVWALEAHNAPALLQEFLGAKADDVRSRERLWKVLGRPAPPGKLPESFRATVMFLRGLGLRLDLFPAGTDSAEELPYLATLTAADVARVRLALATDKNIRHWSQGEVTSLLPTPESLPEDVCGCADEPRLAGRAFRDRICPRCKEAVRPRLAHGLLSETLFGRTSSARRTRMAHLSLASAVVNPLLIEGLSELLDMDLQPWVAWMNVLVAGQEMTWDRYVAEQPDAPALSGAEYIAWRLHEVLGPRGGSEEARAARNRVKAVARWVSDPEDAVLRLLPVLPVALRPVHARQEEDYVGDLTEGYRRILQANRTLSRRTLLPPNFLRREMLIAEGKRELQRTVGALFWGDRGGEWPRRGILDLLSGKEGILRHGLLGKRVNYSGRAVIVPDPTLDLGACRLPASLGRAILEGAVSPGRARRPRTLESLLKDRVVLLNRAPSLHRYNILAFRPHLTEDSTIGLPPLVCGGFNADFDGDTMAIHVPVCGESQAEAAARCSPVRHLRSIASGGLTFHLAQDIIAGVFLGSRRPEGRNGLAASLTKHCGRPARLPAGPLQKRDLTEFLSASWRDDGAEAAAHASGAIARWAFEEATRSGLTLSLSDIIHVPPADRARALDEILRERGLSSAAYVTLAPDTRAEIADAWLAAIQRRVEEQLRAALDGESPNPLAVLVLSGARGDVKTATQLGGMRVVPGPGGRVLAEPVTASFREGLSPLEFFLSGYGSRKSMIDKKIVVAEAGDLTRRLVEAAYRLVIAEEGPCADRKGLRLTGFPALGGEKAVPLRERLFGRVPLENVVAAGTVVARAEEPMSAAAVAAITAAWGESGPPDGVRVRSPLTCQGTRGLCRHCYGWDPSTQALPEIGLPVGIIAGQSIGERGTQLTMRTFHTGGVRGEDITSGLPRVRRLTGGRVDLRLWRVTDPGSSGWEAGAERNEWDLLCQIEEAAGTGGTPPGVEPARDPAGRWRDQTYRLDHMPNGPAHDDPARLFAWLMHRVYKGDVDDRHFEVILRAMRREERFVGVTAAARSQSGFLARATFQGAARVLASAAIQQVEDRLGSYKERVVLGQPIRPVREESR